VSRRTSGAGRWRRRTARVGLVGAALAGLVAGLVVGGPPAGASAEASAVAGGRKTFTGEIDGAEYRVELPARWNGTLVLYSHGYFLAEWVPEGVQVANRVETEQWLIEHGYAVGASKFKHDGVGYGVQDAVTDQVALLDWFEEHVGEPRRTVSSGMSQGGLIAALLAERNPKRFDGVAAMCAEYDTHATWNSGLDITFVVKTLLAPGEDIELVRAGEDAAAGRDALAAAIDRALETPEGRARLALAGAVANIPGWYAAHEPKPKTTDELVAAQSLWTKWAYSYGIGPVGRTELEARAGGNPSWNTGIDYGRLLARSSQQDLVRDAYAAAPGGDLDADLKRLAKAPRIRPDAKAVAYQYRHGIVRGTTPSPVVTLHSTGDGGAVTDQERWYADQIRRHGDSASLRQLWVDRGGHCSFSSADELVMLRSLLDRIDDGRWPSTTPTRLNASVSAMGPAYQKVLDLGTGADLPLEPAYTSFTPPRMLRPSR